MPGGFACRLASPSPCCKGAPGLAIVATYLNGRGCSPLASALSKTRRRQPQSPLCYGGIVRQHAAEPLRSPSVLLSPVESRQGSSRGAEGGGAAPARAAGTTAHGASTVAAARAPGCRRGSRPSSPAGSPAVAADWTQGSRPGTTGPADHLATTSRACPFIRPQRRDKLDHARRRGLARPLGDRPRAGRQRPRADTDHHHRGGATCTSAAPAHCRPSTARSATSTR